MARNLSDPSEYPVRGRGSPHRSPSRRDRSPARHRSSRTAGSPQRGKPSSRTRSPKRANPSSSVSRSPSPRTKRLMRAQAEREVEKSSDREHERNHGRGSDRATHREKGSDKEHLSEKRERGSDREHLSEKRERGSDREHLSEKRERGSDREHLSEKRERGSDREVLSEKRERRSGREAVDISSSRTRHERSTSPADRHHRSRHRSRSPDLAADSRARDEDTNSRGVEHRNGDDDSVAKMKAAAEALEAKQKDKPSFELSGKLAAETNRVRGVTLLFNEPSDARKPNVRWRLYVFKGGEVLNEPLYVHRQTCYLFGRERRVADIPTDHPSCSKQHAVLQYRQVEKEQPDGTLSKQVMPYIMDLGSTNGTFLNDNRIEAQRYYELLEKDTIKFGNSSREYVMLHENSAG